MSMAALEAHTARLPAVEIVRPAEVLGRSTVESIQSGLYYGTLATVRSLAGMITKEHFAGRRPSSSAPGLSAALRGGGPVRRIRARAPAARIAARGGAFTVGRCPGSEAISFADVRPEFREASPPHEYPRRCRAVYARTTADDLES